MKTNFIIISALILSITGAFTLQAISQERDKCPSVVNSAPKGCVNGNVAVILPAPVLIADETLLSYGINEVKIECDNETIFRKIHKSHSQLIKRFTCTPMFTGHSFYKRYVVYMNREDAAILINWAKKNL